jgi:hypothetical protein
LQQNSLALKQHSKRIYLVDVFYLFQIDHCSVQLSGNSFFDTDSKGGGDRSSSLHRFRAGGGGDRRGWGEAAKGVAQSNFSRRKITLVAPGQAWLI